jgi:hypothetical protein
MIEELTPRELISAAATALEVHPFVHAIWLEGSHASGYTDGYSDIDLWADVDAGSEEEAFDALRQGLLTLGSLELEHAPDHPHPQIRQRFYRLEGTSPYLFLDVCLQQHGRGTRLPAHEPFKVLYDPGGIVQMEPERDVRDTVFRRLDVLRAGWWRRMLVLKEVERGQGLEALGYYHKLVLEPLTELLRLCHCPEKHDYGLKHIHRDLPADVVRELEALYSVVTLGELPAAVARANALFERVSRVVAQE